MHIVLGATAIPPPKAACARCSIRVTRIRAPRAHPTDCTQPTSRVLTIFSALLPQYPRPSPHPSACRPRLFSLIFLIFSRREIHTAKHTRARTHTQTYTARPIYTSLSLSLLVPFLRDPWAFWNRLCCFVFESYISRNN